jgi:oligogalacturonide transport system substrate-binding protein
MKSAKIFVRLAMMIFLFCGITQVFSQQVNLRFSWWGGDARHKATLEAIDKYMKLNPNVKIQPEYGGADGYLDKMKIQLASQTAPDIMQIDQTWIEELISKGDFFVDLSKLKEINSKAFDANFLKLFCIYNGKLLGLPTGMNAQIMLVNKTAATKMGVNIKALSDWDTLLAEGKKLHDKDKNYYLLLHDTGSFAGEVLSGMTKQLSGKPGFNPDYTMNFNKAENIRQYKWLNDAVKQGLLEPPGDAALYSFKGEQNPKWINQQIIALVDWTSNYTRYLAKDNTEYTVVLPPNVKNSKTGASMMRPSQEICLNAKSPNAKEAAKFLNWFLNDPESAVILGDVRSVPVSDIARKAATDAGKINKLTSEAISVATKSPKLNEIFIGNNRQITEIALDVAMKVEFGSLTPEQAADEIYKRQMDKLAELKAAAK